MRAIQCANVVWSDLACLRCGIIYIATAPMRYADQIHASIRQSEQCRERCKFAKQAQCFSRGVGAIVQYG